MSSLSDIEEAAVKLPAGEQQKLLRFLLSVVPVSDSELPSPREFSTEEIKSWLAEDKAGMRKFQAGK